MALPGKLELLCEALNFEHRKADDAVMRKLAKPRKPKQGEDPNVLYWHDTPENLEALSRYCCKDIECEREADCQLPPLSNSEQVLWFIDQRVNDRGFAIYLPLVEASLDIIARATPEQLATFSALTGIKSPACRAKLIDWLREHGCSIPNLKKETVEETLACESLGKDARLALEIRRDTTRAAANKAAALKAWCGDDGRVRGTLNYHGAATGRWAGRGPQPQNFRRDTEGGNAKIAAVLSGDLVQVKALGSPFEVIGDISREMIVAAPGHRLLIGDFTGIESMVLAGIAGQQSKLDQWTKYIKSQNLDDHPYMAEGLSLGYTDKEQAYKKGKISDLAFGYMGGLKAYRNFAPPGDHSTDGEIFEKQGIWQSRHPKAVEFWYEINALAIEAVRNPHTPYCYDNKIQLLSNGSFLRITLPSGRSIHYPFPRIATNRRMEEAVIFKDNAGGRWADYHRGPAHPGTWTENIVSGFARDLLAEAMKRLEVAGYKIILTVHDEIVAEMPDGEGSLEEFKQLIEILPDWAGGMPVACKAREGLRFAKPEKKDPRRVTAPAVVVDQPEPAPSTVVRVAFVITHAMKMRLRELGHTEDDIFHMTPEQAHEIIDTAPEPTPASAAAPASPPPPPPPSPAPPPASTPPDAFVTDPAIAQITVFGKVGGPLTKSFTLGPNGELISDSNHCRMSRGVAVRQNIKGAHDFGALIRQMKSEYAIAIGSLKPDLAWQVNITTKGRLDANSSLDEVARSKEFLEFREGSPGIVLFDFDGKSMPLEARKRLEQLGGFEAAILALAPILETAGRVWRASTSSGLYRVADAHKFEKSGGEHLYVLVENAADIPRFVRAMHDAAWAVGLGWFMISASGALLAREGSTKPSPS
jgi:DNA polymerase